MAGMKYLADYDKYNVTEAEIEELKQKNQEQQIWNEEAEWLWQDTDNLQEENKKVEEQLIDLEKRNEDLDLELEKLKHEHIKQENIKRLKDEQIIKEKAEIERL